jgi:3-oxoacyl-[acyl-carrier-protein] synthase-3
VVTAAPRTVKRARISSIATYVPPKVLSNADLEKMVETTDEWILQRTGIRERHIAASGVGTSDLAYEAAKKAIERAGLTPHDIDLIIVGTTTPDMAFPSTACLLQAKLGADHAWGFDLSAACSGFTYSLTTAAHIVAAGGSRHALVIGADVMSSIIDYTDRTTCVLFGDGAGAVVVEPTDDDDIGIIDFENYVARRCACRPAAVFVRRRTRRSISGSITSSRKARPSSSSPCATWKRSAAAFSRATTSTRPTSTCSRHTRRTGASSS